MFVFIIISLLNIISAYTTHVISNTSDLLLLAPIKQPNTKHYFPIDSNGNPYLISAHGNIFVDDKVILNLYQYSDKLGPETLLYNDKIDIFFKYLVKLCTDDCQGFISYWVDLSKPSIQGYLMGSFGTHVALSLHLVTEDNDNINSDFYRSYRNYMKSDYVAKNIEYNSCEICLGKFVNSIWYPISKRCVSDSVSHRKNELFISSVCTGNSLMIEAPKTSFDENYISTMLVYTVDFNLEETKAVCRLRCLEEPNCDVAFVSKYICIVATLNQNNTIEFGKGQDNEFAYFKSNNNSLPEMYCSKDYISNGLWCHTLNKCMANTDICPIIATTTPFEPTITPTDIITVKNNSDRVNADRLFMLILMTNILYFN